jgi:two-component system response regulator DesR
VTIRRPLPWTGLQPPTVIRVVVVSVDTLFAEAVAAVLATNDGIDVTGIATNGASATRAIAALRPTVAVIDDRRLDGATALLAACRTSHPAVKGVLVTDVRVGGQDRRGEHAGFDGVVHRASTLERLIAVVREVCWYESARTRAPHHQLSPRELEVLCLLAEGCDTRAMASTLFLSHHTVRNHVRNVLKKLDVRSRAEAVATAVRFELV